MSKRNLDENIRLFGDSKLLFFDLETTGLPIFKKSKKLSQISRYYNPTEYRYYDKSRIIQISWCLDKCNCDTDLDNISNIIIKPDDFVIENSYIHGISQKYAMEKGVSFNEAIDTKFKNALVEADYVIAHNAMFDTHILMSELYRYEFHGLYNILKELLDDNKIICTGELGRNITKIPLTYAKFYKMPRLGEIYKFYYDEEMNNAHNAIFDVYAMMKVFNKILYDTVIF